MANEETWKSSPPGSDAADLMRGRIRGWMEQVEKGQLDEVRESLGGDAWKHELDFEGVPDEVVPQTRDILVDAEAALGADDADAANDALRRALVIW